MIDADTTVMTELRYSTSGHLSPGCGDPDPCDLDRLAASLDHLALRCYNAARTRLGDHVAIEPMGGGGSRI